MMALSLPLSVLDLDLPGRSLSPWTFRTYDSSMKSHTESVGRLMGQGLVNGL